ncbi:4-hydroxyphenylacetate 3-hydroxylase family protein [Propionibacterium sp.]|uniref:4-hydroxyphenylacetate 3-hydroxylase family protein n=1 Tax=Propionibacterium sp. TaxID=1977903 RepID=UPI0039ED8AB0
MRSGKEYLDSLDDGRTVIIDGEPVENVREHPAFKGLTRSVAALFDISADPDNGFQVYNEEIGKNVNRLFYAPKSREELTERRKVIEKWAEYSHGWLGRTPDHVSSFLAGFAARSDLYGQEDGHDYAANVLTYQAEAAANDWYITYAIVPPQISRATTASGWEGEFLQVGVVKETEEGLIVRGSQMLATASPVTDEILVTCIKPLSPDDSDVALSFALPIATTGLKLYSRRPYAPAATSSFDYPLTTRFDESDCLVVFDDVLVPWDRVFINQNVEKTKLQFFDTPAHVLGNWQAQIRLATKLKFIAAVAHKATQINQTNRIPGVREKLGELAALATSVESAVLASEYTAEIDKSGTCVPGAKALYSSMGLQSEVYPRVINILRDLVGGGVLQLPSSVKDLESDFTKDDVARYVQSPGTPSTERVKLFKLAWDILGSEFGGRHQQYEMFYAGAPFIVKGVYAYQNFDYPAAVADLDDFLNSYGPDGPISEEG